MFCPKCGTNVDDSYAFCFRCGFDFSKLNQSEDTSKQNCAQSATESENSSMLEFDYFDGTQEQFDKIYYDLCYVLRNYQKLKEFEEYIKIKYPNTVYEYKPFCGENTTTEINGTYDQNNSRVEFDYFKGSQEQFDEIYYDLCYVKRDFEKLLAFEEYASAKFPKTDYEYNFSCGINTKFLLISSYTKEHDFLKCVSDDDLNDGTVQTLTDNFAFCLSVNYFMNLFGWRIYNFFGFIFKYNLAWEKYLKLQDAYDKEENDDRKNSIKWEMETIPRKFGRTTWSYEGSIVKKFELLDLNRIQSQGTKLAEQYSNELSRLYIVILNNAIRIHKADYLRELYPTDLQKQKIAKIIENEISDKFRNSTRNLYVVMQKERECREICANINKMSEKFSDSSLLTKGLTTAALTFFSGPLGIINGLREGYNLYEADNKVTELKNKLENEFDSCYDELVQLHNDMCECSDKLGESMKTNITDKYLVNAINDIFKKLQDNGVVLLPLNKYLE